VRPHPKGQQQEHGAPQPVFARGEHGFGGRVDAPAGRIAQRSSGTEKFAHAVGQGSAGEARMKARGTNFAGIAHVNGCDRSIQAAAAGTRGMSIVVHGTVTTVTVIARIVSCCCDTGKPPLDTLPRSCDGHLQHLFARTLDALAGASRDSAAVVMILIVLWMLIVVHTADAMVVFVFVLFALKQGIERKMILRIVMTSFTVAAAAMLLVIAADILKLQTVVASIEGLMIIIVGVMFLLVGLFWRVCSRRRLVRMIGMLGLAAITVAHFCSLIIIVFGITIRHGQW